MHGSPEAHPRSKAETKHQIVRRWDKLRKKKEEEEDGGTTSLQPKIVNLVGASDSYALLHSSSEDPLETQSRKVEGRK